MPSVVNPCVPVSAALIKGDLPIVVDVDRRRVRAAGGQGDGAAADNPVIGRRRHIPENERARGDWCADGDRGICRNVQRSEISNRIDGIGRHSSGPVRVDAPGPGGVTAGEPGPRCRRWDSS